MRLGASRPITEVGVKSELVALKRCDGIRAAELAFQCSVEAPSMRVCAPFTNSASAHNCERGLFLTTNDDAVFRHRLARTAGTRGVLSPRDGRERGLNFDKEPESILTSRRHKLTPTE